MLAPGKKPIRFALKKEFREKLKNTPIKWGFEGLSEFTFYRTYSRNKDDGTMETWADCVIRVIEGMFSLLKTHCISSYLPWEERKAHRLAEEAATRMFEFKWLPPGRGLWMMNTSYMWERGAIALYNCAYTSTKDIDKEFSKPFAFAMDLLMCGVGVGYDTRGADKAVVYEPIGDPEIIIVDDTREGWVEAISCLIDSYLDDTSDSAPVFIDTYKVRPYGKPIKGFGGVASGPEPLQQGFNGIKDILHKRIGKYLRSTDIVDIFDIIGKVVVAGNVRRCLPLDAIIQTDKGLKEIKDVVENDYVITGGKRAKVLNSGYSGHKKLLQIKHRFGQLRCSEDHKVAVFTDIDKYTFKVARDLNIGDRLVWDSIGIEGTEQELPPLTENLHFNAKTFTIPKTLDTDIAWLFGLIHGDGYVGDGAIEIAATSHEIGNLEKANSIFENKFGLIGKITKINNKNCYRLRLHSSALVRWFNINLKKSNTDIILPDYIKNSTIACRFAYLAGLFDSDGRTKKDGVIEQVATIYPTFNSNIISLLASLGVGVATGFYSKEKQRQKNNSNAKDYYSIRIVGNTNRKFWTNNIRKFSVSNKLLDNEDFIKSPVDFSYPVKMFKDKPDRYKPDGSVLISSPLISCSRYYPTPITEITIEKVNTPTWDIEVENINQFTTDGIVVHNSALLALGDPNDKEFSNLKNYTMFPVETGVSAPFELQDINIEDFNKFNTDVNARSEIIEKYKNMPWAYKFNGYRWSSNNSILGEVGMDYSDIAENIAMNGEPGIVWIDNCRKYGRFKDGINTDDQDVMGVNPCSEIQLNHMEVCNLNENFPAKHKDYWDFQRSLKFSYLYSKAVTLLATHWEETNAIISKNRRIGCSISGIQEAFAKFGRRAFLEEWCDQAYDYIQYVDKKYSDWLGVPRSIRKTTVKPSGTTSLVAGSLPGIHYPESTSYYRTVRIASTSPLISILEKANYKIEPAHSDPQHTRVVYFPVIHNEDIISKKNISIWAQFKDTVDINKYYSDNMVSVTVTFNSSEASQIATCLAAFENELKSISLLPISDHGYAQAPYIPAPIEEVLKYKNTLSKLDFSSLTKSGENAEANKFCSNDSCLI